MFLNLAQRIARQLLDGFKPTRDFEGSQLLAATHFERAGIAAPVFPNYIRHRDLATHAVGLRHHRRFLHFRLLHQEFLDLPGIDVETAGYDEVALAAAKRDVSVCRERSNVAGLEPAIHKRSPGGLFALPIPRENV